MGKSKMKYVVLTILLGISGYSTADGFASGIPTAIQKTDYNDLHLIYIKLDKPTTAVNNCDSSAGLVVHDSNESSKAALSLAMTALAAGKKYQCFIRTNNCSAITGSDTTYPVCEYYPTLKN